MTLLRQELKRGRGRRSPAGRVAVVDADVPPDTWVAVDLAAVQTGPAGLPWALSGTRAPVLDIVVDLGSGATPSHREPSLGERKPRRVPEADLIDVAPVLGPAAAGEPPILDLAEVAAPQPASNLIPFVRGPVRRRVLLGALSAAVLLGAVYTAVRWGEGRVITVDDPGSPSTAIT